MKLTHAAIIMALFACTPVVEPIESDDTFTKHGEVYQERFGTPKTATKGNPECGASVVGGCGDYEDTAKEPEKPVDPCACGPDFVSNEPKHT